MGAWLAVTWYSVVSTHTSGKGLCCEATDAFQSVSSNLLMRRTAKYVLDVYLPVLADLRHHLQGGQLRTMLDLIVVYSVR